MTEVTLVRGDKGFDLEFTVQEADASAFDLTGATVKFKMAVSQSGSLKIDGPCTITDPLQGKCKYTIGDTDLDTAGQYVAELEITIGAKIVTITDILVKVIKDLPQGG